MKSSKKAPKISFLIPCYNEEKTIGKCIQSVLGQSLHPFEVIVINDGSTDKSRKIISSFKEVRLINLERNTGNKAKAIEVALKQVKGDFVALTDADTILEFDFLEQAVKPFKEENVGAVSGKVISNKRNMITGARQIEYIISQELHKKGQSILGAVFVIPGCAALYRKSVIEKISLEHDTLTEDLDITFKTHKLGYKIVYQPKAIVYTNDPFDLVSYTRQIKRWYVGTFQNLKKHRDVIGKGILGKIEIPLILFENFFFGFIYLFLPILFFINPTIVGAIVLFDLLTVLVIALYGILRLKRFSLILSIPAYYFLKIWQNLVWFYAFISVVAFKQKDLYWYRAKR